MVGKFRSDESKWLSHVYFFTQVTMKKHIVHIQLSNDPEVLETNREYESDRFNYQIKGLRVVKA